MSVRWWLCAGRAYSRCSFVDLRAAPGTVLTETCPWSMVMDEEEERPFFGVVHIRIPPQCPSSSSPTETEMCYQYNAPADIAAVPCPMCKVFKPSAARYSRPRPRLHALTRPQLSPPPRRLLQQSQPSPHRRRPSQERRRCVPRPLTAPRPHTPPQ